MKAFAELGTIVKILWRWICGLIKVAWTLATLIIVGITATFVVLIFVDTEISHTVSNRYYVYKHNMIDRYCIYDSRNGKKTEKWISSIDKKVGEDSLIRFSRKDFWGNKERFGYIDARTGKVAIEPQFYYAGEFSEGLAAARGENGVGFIDTTGKIVVPVKGCIVGSKRAKIHKGTAAVRINDKRYGIISVSGEWALEANYDKIEHVNNGIYIVITENYKHGVWCASKGWIFEPIYENIEERLGDRFEITNNGICWEADLEGKTTKPLIYDSSEQLFYYPAGYDNGGDGIATEYFKFYIDDKACGVLNIRTKEVVLPAIYDNIEMKSRDIFELTMDLQTYLGYKDGTVVPIKTK